jgi:hypothetical protein
LSFFIFTVRTMHAHTQDTHMTVGPRTIVDVIRNYLANVMLTPIREDL